MQELDALVAAKVEKPRGELAPPVKREAPGDVLRPYRTNRGGELSIATSGVDAPFREGSYDRRQLCVVAAQAARQDLLPHQVSLTQRCRASG
jgi:hypothetical protein